MMTNKTTETDSRRAAEYLSLKGWSGHPAVDNHGCKVMVMSPPPGITDADLDHQMDLAGEIAVMDDPM